MKRQQALPVFTALCLAALLLPRAAAAEDYAFKNDMLRALVDQVPSLLKSQDAKTGRFGTGIWIVQDQHKMWPLAVAWGTRHADNPYYHSPDLLDAVMKAGDALIADQDAEGRWEFRKKDGSTWGPRWMTWTYTRWICSFSIVKDAMPAARRARWEKALTLGYTGIAAKELETIHNIPAYQAAGLFCAGVNLNRPDWRDQAAAFLRRVAEHQNPGGYWSENAGPVVGYNFLYMEALGIYYGMSRDAAVLPALLRGSRYHANFTYPDGSAVETIDERQIYHAARIFPNVGFTFSPEGRAYLRAQWAIAKRKGANAGNVDRMATSLTYGEEGAAAPPPGSEGAHTFVLGDNDAVVHREGPWFVCLSAFRAEIPGNRWIQDRQNFVSLFHEKTGLILGGGNTKLQPYWSAFCVGDPTRLSHTAGNSRPDFAPPTGIAHVPGRTTLDPTNLALSLDYNATRCRIDVDLVDDHRATLTFSVDPESLTSPTIANLTLLPHPKIPWAFENGPLGALAENQPIAHTLETGDAWFEYGDTRLSLPKGASVHWPVYGHDPYKKGGEGSFEYARVVVTLPLTRAVPRHAVTFSLRNTDMDR